MADREGNVTALFYVHGQPPASGSDTQQIVLEVCQEEGLQQVIWLSRPFAEAEIPSAYAAIYREGFDVTARRGTTSRRKRSFGRRGGRSWRSASSRAAGNASS